MRAQPLDPVHVRRLQEMSPEERLKAAIGLNGLSERLAKAGREHRRSSTERRLEDDRSPDP